MKSQQHNFDVFYSSLKYFGIKFQIHDLSYDGQIYIWVRDGIYIDYAYM